MMAHKNPEDRKEYQRQFSLRTRARRVERDQVRATENSELLETLKTECLFCGSNDEILFHHINSNIKLRNVCSMTQLSAASIKQEATKCWCLCQSCHIKLHQRLVDPLPSCYDNYTIT